MASGEGVDVAENDDTSELEDEDLDTVLDCLNLR